MKTIADILERLKAASGALRITEADVIQEVQTDAFQAGYAQAARELFGIALESEERMDNLMARAADAGVVSVSKLAH